MKEKNKGYILLRRETFIEARYVIFKKKRAFLDEIDPHQALFHQTDLDAACGIKAYPNRLLSDIVICDRCNENIEDKKFLFYEKSRCYHVKCVEGYALPDKPKRKPATVISIEPLFDNVVNLSAWLEKKENES